jgi:hypothetical protein
LQVSSNSLDQLKYQLEHKFGRATFREVLSLVPIRIAYSLNSFSMLKVVKDGSSVDEISLCANQSQLARDSAHNSQAAT